MQQRRKNIAGNQHPQPAYEGPAIAALVLGIISMCLPVLGLLTGVVGSILAIVALAKKTSRKVFAIVGLILASVAIIGNIGIASLIWYGASGNFQAAPSARDAAVSAQVNEKKDFAAGETAKMGPIDFEVTNVVRGYVPTAEEMQDTTYPGEQTGPNQKTTPITDADAEYILVEATATRNGSASLGDFDYDLESMMLNNVNPYIYEGADFTPYKGENSITVRYVYRIRHEGYSLVMTFNPNIYKTIYPIVGTEGAPRIDLTYTIKLN